MLKLLKTLWMKFAAVLATVNSAVLLSLVFFFIITPIGLFMRLLDKSAFSLSAREPPRWHPIPPVADPRKPF